MMMSIAKLADNGDPAPLASVARDCCLSRGYLDQLVPSLKNASLVSAYPGRGGGYTLKRPAHEILLGDIIRATIGPISITDCASDPNFCEYSDDCNCHALWTLINEKIIEVLDGHTLAELIEDDWEDKVEKILRGD